MSAPKMPPGTVVTYTSERDNRWCREGVALADERGVLFDTFWQSGGDAHRLTDAEVATAEVAFNVGDYRELALHERALWADHHPDDRRLITSQHGLQRRLFVRLGAEPDLHTRIENAREAVRQAESELTSAESRLLSRQEALARLIHGGAS